MRVWTAGAKQRALCDGMPASCRYGDGGADEGKANVSQGRVGSGRQGSLAWVVVVLFRTAKTDIRGREREDRKGLTIRSNSDAAITDCR